MKRNFKIFLEKSGYGGYRKLDFQPPIRKLRFSILVLKNKEVCTLSTRREIIWL